MLCHPPFLLLAKAFDGIFKSICVERLRRAGLHTHVTIVTKLFLQGLVRSQRGVSNDGTQSYSGPPLTSEQQAVFTYYPKTSTHSGMTQRNIPQQSPCFTAHLNGRGWYYYGCPVSTLFQQPAQPERKYFRLLIGGIRRYHGRIKAFAFNRPP